MSERLSGDELTSLVRRVFQPRAEDAALAILVDLPDGRTPDTESWRRRRLVAAQWSEALDAHAHELGLETHLVLYRNVGTNNGDLPSHAWVHPGGRLPDAADALDPADAVPFAEIYAAHPLLIALTQFSATAPLKVAARHHPIRAATMPGFTEAMVPALRLDYGEVNRRVNLLKDLLDRAEGADIIFRHPGGESSLHLDLRFRTAHASGGLLPEPGVAGNLPSGEAYIVPYEGEREHDPSRSEGTLPVELDGEVVLYRVEANRAVAVESSGPIATREAGTLLREPAYGNLAELGLGVLADFGIEPIGEVLLDEKLGLHIAFGRSEHFGGQVGPAQFSSPKAVVHIDRVYLPQTQPRVVVRIADLRMADGSTVALIRDGAYALGFER